MQSLVQVPTTRRAMRRLFRQLVSSPNWPATCDRLDSYNPPRNGPWIDNLDIRLPNLVQLVDFYARGLPGGWAISTPKEWDSLQFWHYDDAVFYAFPYDYCGQWSACGFGYKFYGGWHSTPFQSLIDLADALTAAWPPGLSGKALQDRQFGKRGFDKSIAPSSFRPFTANPDDTLFV